MTEKRGGVEFDEVDEEAATTLAGWAAIAIENARLYTTLSVREAETERALRQAETSADIARTVGGETDVGRVLDLIVKRARALVEARTVLVLLRRAARLVVAAQAGQVGPEVDELTIPTDDAVFQAAMRERVAQHLEPGTPPSEARLRERLGAEAALVVPLLFRGRAIGDAGRPRPRSGRRFRRGGPAPAPGLRGERRDRRRDGADGPGRAAAAAGRGRRGRAPALGAGAPRRRAAVARRGADHPRRGPAGERRGPRRRGSSGPPKRNRRRAGGADHRAEPADQRPASRPRSSGSACRRRWRRSPRSRATAAASTSPPRSRSTAS